jgi:hypothetical protein
MFSITYQRTRKVWQFPQERFVTYELSDESWCRFFGFGKEVEITETVEFPNCQLTSVEGGVLQFTAYPSYSSPLFSVP